MQKFLLITMLLSGFLNDVSGQIVNTIAGGTTSGSSGDGGVAINATLNRPSGVVKDNSGNIYIADMLNHRIRKIGSDNIITTIAGTGTMGFTGNGGQASIALLNNPASITTDGAGNIYFTESGTFYIRKITPNGIISIFAGTGMDGFTGDGGQATAARLNNPRSLCTDNTGNLFFVDGTNYRIRRISTSGIITTICGQAFQSFSGDGGLAVNATFRNITAVEADPLGNIYIADNGNYRIRKISPSGIISTVAGNNNNYYAGDNVPGTTASFGNINALASDASGNLFILGDARIRKFSTNGIITTIAGTGLSFGTDGEGGSPLLANMNPFTIEVEPDGKIIFGEENYHRIRRISYDLLIASFAPQSGYAGQQASITGGNFTNASAVAFGGRAASFVVNSSTSITATLQSGATGNVTVTTPLGTAMLPGFTFTGPTISSFSPSSGFTGNTITISGTNFSGATAVIFGGKAAASFTILSSTSITAVLADGSSGNLTVTTPLGTASAPNFTFTGPSISSFSPTSSGPGATININGQNLNDVTAVSFGAVPAASFTAYQNLIVAVTGSGASGNISVTSPKGTAIKPGYSFFAPPVVSSFAPLSGNTGTTVTITGSNFTGATSVLFGVSQASSFTVVNSNTITAVVGYGTTGTVKVVTPGGSSSLAGFTYYFSPILHGFSPTSGAAGAIITLTGENFTGATGVTFGGVNAGSLNVISPTSATAVVGAGASGAVGITTQGGTITRPGFTFIPGPVISGISPTSAGTDSTVTITGTNFNNITGVKFGGVSANSFTLVNSTTVTAKPGNGASGNVDVTGLAGAGTMGGFTYVPFPTITSFSPISSIAGGSITITGTNLASTSKVMFGTTQATSFTVLNSSTVTAVVGAGSSGAVSVSTTGGTGSLGGFTFIPAPFIYGFTPPSAAQGATVTINGIGFNNTTAVSFGGVPAASFSVVSSAVITAVVGLGSSGSVSVTAIGGVATRPGFTLIPPPVISSFTPNNSVTEQSVTITGTNLTGATLVKFGGTNATSFTVVNTTTITAVVGEGSSGNISVTTPGGTATGSGFEFISPPAISTFNPASATAGASITITGTNFTGITSVWFGGSPASSFTIVDATTIIAIVGSGSSGYISVENPAGIGTRAGFIYIPLPPPVMTSFSPASSGPGLPVTIRGNNLGSTTGISLGGTPAASFVVNNGTTVTAVVGAGSSGSVSLTTSSGSVGLPGFTFIPGPTITSFSPANGPSGTVVNISGTNFTNVLFVKFGNLNASTFTVVNATTITAIVGNGASGSISIVSINGVATTTGFNFITAPIINSVGPAIISHGDEVVINGSNFTNVNRVSFGGTAAASYTVVSPVLIKAVAGQGSSGIVAVSTPGGTAIRDGVIYTYNICPDTNTIFNSEITGSNYRWQVNAGNGFTDISNNSNYSDATTASLQLTNVPSSFYGYQYRCLVNGVRSKTFIIRITNSWTGAVSNLWNNTGNWGCTLLPDSNTDVRINAGTVLLNIDTTVRSILVKPGVNFTVPTGRKLKLAGKQKMIEKVSLAQSETILFANTSGLIMLPGEQAFLAIRQLTANAADSIPSGLTYSSSNAGIASFGSDGKVIALAPGMCKVTATNAQGKTMTCQVAVLASGSPTLNEPIFVGFDAPIVYINTDNGDKAKAIALNRLGHRLPDPVSIVFRDNHLQQAVAANSKVNTEDGVYILTATVGEKMLLGGSVAVVYKNINSTVMGEWSPALLATGVTNPPPGIFSVSLEWGKYPMYFTRLGVTSEPVTGLVLRMVPYEIMAAGVPTGSYGLTISTSVEDVNVQSENNTVVFTSGNTITSLGAGVGRWRVVHENYIGPWHSSHVFGDYSGDWYCADDARGHNIKLRIPEVAPQVILGGVLGSSLNIYDQYGQNSKSVAWAQENLGIGQITANTTDAVSSSLFNVEIGPFTACLICNFGTVPQGPGGGFGYLTLENQRRNGDLTYNSPTQFSMYEIDTIRRNIVFVKQPINFAPYIASFSPSAAAAGSTVTIIGNNFNGTTSVTLGGVAVFSFTVVSNDKITAVVGAGASGKIAVTNAGGTGSLSGFNFLNTVLPPKLNSFSPTSATQGMTVMIFGNNLSGSTSVKFGGVNASSFIVIDDFTIHAIVGNGASGQISVTKPSGTASIAGFKYGIRPPEFFEVKEDNEMISYSSLGQNTYYNGWYFSADSLTIVNGTSVPYKIVVTGNNYFIGSKAGGTFSLGNPSYDLRDSTKLSVSFERPHPDFPEATIYGSVFGSITIMQECSSGDLSPYWVGFIDATVTYNIGGFITKNLTGIFRFYQIPYFIKDICE